MYSFASEYNLIVLFQYGFQSGLSTSDALLEYANEAYKTFNDREINCIAFLDFREAFDCVNVDILLMKLDHMGFRGIINEYIRSFLSNRYQYVSGGPHSSREGMVTRGVPQGSTLGPLLFLLYVNDMHRSAPDLSFIHYADDTTISFQSDNFGRVKTAMEQGLLSINEWLTVNRLALNVDKTSFMVIKNKTIPDDFQICISNVPFSMIDHSRFLGIVINRKFTFSNHIDTLSKKLSKIIGLLSRLSSIIPQKYLRFLYYSMFYPVLIYGITIWGSTGIVQFSRMQVIQNRVVRLITPSNTVDPYSYLKLLKLSDIYNYFVLIKIYKVVKSGDGYFGDIINEHRANNLYNTRFMTDENFLPHICHTSKSQSSFIYNGIKLWNELQVDVRSAQCLSSFKESLNLNFCHVFRYIVLVISVFYETSL